MEGKRCLVKLTPYGLTKVKSDKIDLSRPFVVTIARLNTNSSIWITEESAKENGLLRKGLYVGENSDPFLALKLVDRPNIFNNQEVIIIHEGI